MVVVVSREHVSSSPDSFIAVSDQDLAEYFQGIFPQDQSQQVLVLQRLLEGLCGIEARELSRSLEGGFSYFSQAAAGQPATARFGSWDDVDAAELLFLSEFWEVMRVGGYRHVSKQEWEVALADDFMCTLPVTVNYSALDNRLLHRFWESRGEQEREELPPQLADRCLVFYRGVGVAKMEGSYFSAKLQRLIYFVVLRPLWKIAAKIRELLRVGQNTTAVAQIFNAQPTPSEDEAGPGEAGASQACVHTERRTFARVLPDAKAILQQLFKKVTLQEACFQDVIILYRRAVGAAEALKGEEDVEVLSDKSKAPSARNLHIKHFKSIPLADLEMVLPEKAVFVPPSALLEIVVTFVLGLAAVVSTLRQGKLNLYVVWSALAALCAHALEVRNRAQNERSLVEEQMGKMLYDRTVASQEAVLQTLLEEMRRQRSRELFLAYCTLLHSPQPLTVTQLEVACEQILKQEFGVLVAFDIVRALAMLRQWGLVAEGPGGTLQAVPLEVSLQCLDATWDSLFNVAKVPAAQAHQAPGSDSDSPSDPTFPVPPTSWQPGLSAAALRQRGALGRLRPFLRSRGGLAQRRAWVRTLVPALAVAGRVV